MTQLREIIRRDGPIGIDRYMELCLGDPSFGYYMTRDPLGRGGDFVTAPEISQVFGEMIGLWTAAVWQQLGAPPAFRLVELGPGRGTLMADALRALKALPACRAAAHVALVEISPALRRRQEALLGERHRDIPVTWHERIETIAADMPMIIIANEFFDALPIRQWVRRADTWFERRVGTSQDRLTFVDGEPAELPHAPASAADGDILEIGEAACALAATLGGRLRETRGACLVIDYGYAGPRLGDSLQAVRDHTYAPVLETPGEADLTAHVDFTALGEAFAVAGASVAGPVAQGHWLAHLGAGARAESLMRGKETATIATISQGLRRLLDPMAMGTLFKVMAASSNDLGPLPGLAA